MNLETDQYLNTGKSIKGEVLIQSEEYVPQDVKNVNQLLADANKENTITLYHHNANDLTDPNMSNKDKIAGDDSYRFSGPDADVKNYVCLDSKTTGECETDDDLYRIIGLFKNTDEASEDYGKYEMKLIKASAATTIELGDNKTADGGAYYSGTKYYWNSTRGTSYSSNNVNMWTESNLNKVNLNQFFYDYITTRATYLQGHITEHIWTTGGMATYGDAKATYDLELGEGKVKVDDKVCYTQGNTSTTRECTQEDIEYTDHIGLMYISDYMYGTIPSGWTTSASSTTIGNNNWLKLGTTEWSISRNSSSGHGARYVYSAGFASTSDYVDVEDSYAARPSFYLMSDAKIKEGEGSKTKPYRITFE